MATTDHGIRSPTHINGAFPTGAGRQASVGLVPVRHPVPIVSRQFIMWADVSSTVKPTSD
ncbi:hypothetical protein CFI14_08485 [Lactiplantibacillus pentosus]|uniref:hypothetical protein n=1 Tax=Lactiplantibacillus pentosus TaxID=1589 RepID=UPI000EAA1B5F|nr:hypothetical protein [Lactiplantibacillus pentosus]AYG38476.1 hypothetical protein CFK27_11330 [Lactiplantibacillus pentosus]AYG41136.1 hypothetical protein CFI14_08485 [Lactiplantibacillus pentosus]MCJ8180821.1 hypothetical protein [Lactiplantibacillus pentosus]